MPRNHFTFEVFPLSRRVIARAIFILAWAGSVSAQRRNGLVPSARRYSSTRMVTGPIVPYMLPLRNPRADRDRANLGDTSDQVVTNSAQSALTPLCGGIDEVPGQGVLSVAAGGVGGCWRRALRLPWGRFLNTEHIPNKQ